VSPAERNVAMVFQNLALFPHMTAEQNVRFPLVERGGSEAEIENRASAVSAKLHIGHHPAQASGAAVRAASGSVSPSPARWCAIRPPI
jgi:multiple sugar transport system ATP-binding protein